jgi:hypothetical protein
MVAHAASMSNWAFEIYSKKQKSTLHGAQYLHRPIPGINLIGPHQVEYRLRGTPEDYRSKVYGREWDGTVSPEDLAESHFAWDLRKAYDWLWRNYEPWIVDMEINPDSIAKLRRFWDKCDLVISTVPRKIWATNGDIFESTKIWALGDSDPDGGLANQDDFTVICDGTSDCNWYRSAKIFGHSTLEWPYTELWLKPPANGAVIVEKPLRCETKNGNDFTHLGRYGAWEKGILTSDVFYQAMEVLANDQIE